MLQSGLFIALPWDIEQRLFASGPDRFGPVLRAAGQLAFHEPTLDLDRLLEPIASVASVAASEVVLSCCPWVMSIVGNDPGLSRALLCCSAARYT